MEALNQPFFFTLQEKGGDEGDMKNSYAGDCMIRPQHPDPSLNGEQLAGF
jgi:hypothetical protein